MKLLDKVAVITGAGRGIGKAIALEMAKQGAKIVVVDKVVEGANTVVEEIGILGRKGLAVQADISKKKDVDKIVQAALSNFKRIDILVNNAGVVVYSPSTELSEEDWNSVIGTDLTGTFFCSQAVGRVMIAQKGGRIINIASTAGVVARPEGAAYCSAKCGVMMLTKVLAFEWAKYNIQVNAIAPGYAETKMLLDNVSKGAYDLNTIKRGIPMGRLAKPEEIAKVAVFLASDDSSYMTGGTLCVDGGYAVSGYPATS